ncbi:hypothetical protein Tco_1042446 [Tanacetum coccineum]|uniref:Uncharacterized protein n=1 Tax=Tanacetum coccineum TaxID=301880 RepID=A0ABQ5GJ41_9ASTR
MSNESVELTQSTPTSEISTPLIGFEMSSPDEISTQTSGVRMRGDVVRMRGAGVRIRDSSEDVGSEVGSSSSNRRLKTINGKIVRMRWKGDGSRAYMYHGGRKPIGFGVSWDPVNGEAMLGNVMGIPALAWPIKITLEDCRIHAQRPEPVLLQELMLEPLVRRIVQYQRRVVVHEEPVQLQGIQD